MHSSHLLISIGLSELYWS